MSPEQWRQWRGCGSKMPYPSRKVAKEAAQRVPKRTDGNPAYAYACTYCGLWHVGHATRPR